MPRHVLMGAAACRVSAAVFLVICGAWFSEACAGEWPQILGPHRNGVADDETIAAWPDTGPLALWSYALGQGYAGPAVAGGRVVVFHRVDDAERVEALDAKTGRRLWRTDFPATYRGGVNPDTGPRCVPVIHGESVYLFGAAGDLHCVSLADGKKRWSRRTLAEFDGREGYFGTGSTPIVVGDRLWVNVGGKDAGIVAFSLKDGKDVWRVTAEQASYSSPTTAKIDGRQQVIFVTRMKAVSLDARTGKLLFQFPFGRRGPTVNAAVPLVFDEHLFVTANYGIGARLVNLRGDVARPVWDNDEVLSSQYASPVHRQGYLYGNHGREDVGVTALRCLDAETGKVQWSVDRFGVAHIILVDDKLLMLKVEGRLLLADASPKAYHQRAEANVSQVSTRALPALAEGKFYFRDNSGREGMLRCLDLQP